MLTSISYWWMLVRLVSLKRESYNPQKKENWALPIDYETSKHYYSSPLFIDPLIVIHSRPIWLLRSYDNSNKFQKNTFLKRLTDIIFGYAWTYESKDPYLLYVNNYSQILCGNFLNFLKRKVFVDIFFLEIKWLLFIGLQRFQK